MTTVALPRDPALPQLARLLDAEAMSPVLERSLGSDARIDAVRVGYVSYDPGDTVLVQYELMVDGNRHEVVAVAGGTTDLAAQAGGPAAAELVRKVAGRTPAALPIAFHEDLGVLVHWPPLDPAVPALAEPPESLRAVLEGAGVERVGDGEVPTLVHYKPGRRAVFRFGRHLVKLYGNEKNFARSVHNLRAVAELPLLTAHCDAVVPELRIQVQSLLAGEPAGEPAEVAADAGRLLRIVHDAELEGLRSAPGRYWLKSAAKSARLLAAVQPSLSRRLERLVERLEEGIPPDDDLAPCHGDFHARQLLRVDGDFALVDFDRMSIAPPALDLATYVSFVREPGELAQSAAVLGTLVDAYGSRPPGIGWHLAAVLLRRARIPFRRLHDNWPDEVDTRVAAAEAALEL